MSKADVEFYEARLVVKTAQALAKRPLDSLSDAARKRYLDQAVDVVHTLLTDASSIARLRFLMTPGMLNIR
jgi:hypothetical protein